MKNCLTYALDLEEQSISVVDLQLWYSSDKFSAIAEKCQIFNRSCRLVAKDDSLKNDEWLIAFFGFIPYHYNYEGIPDEYDYHFVRKNKDGTWTHRKSKNEEISIADIDFLTNEYKKYGYSPIYLAIRKTEE